MVPLFLASWLLFTATAINPYTDDPSLRGTFSGSVWRDYSRWEVEGYAIPHEALRRELLLGERALKSKFDPTLEWHVDAFYAWYSFFGKFIHGHHWAEETVFFPSIAAKAKEKVPNAVIPDIMTTMHESLMGYLDKISALKTPFEQAKGNNAELKRLGKTLVDEWVAMHSMMKLHLDEEEDFFNPLNSASFTKESFDKLIEEIIIKFNPIDLMWELCPFSIWFDFWCLPASGCSPHAKSDFLAKVPAPLRFVALSFFLPRYEDALAALHSIETGVPHPYSRSPRLSEIVAVVAAAVVLFVAVTLTRKMVRAVLCAVFPSKKKNSSSSSSSTKEKPKKE